MKQFSPYPAILLAIGPRRREVPVGAYRTNRRPGVIRQAPDLRGRPVLHVEHVLPSAVGVGAQRVGHRPSVSIEAGQLRGRANGELPLLCGIQRDLGRIQNDSL